MNTEKGKLIYEEETYAIRGAVFAVYKEMGCGFLEAVYQECLEKELTHRSIPYIAQQELRLTYKGEAILQTYKPDLICFDKIILELKALKSVGPKHKAQLLNYLKVSELNVGLLINFGFHPNVQIERMVL
jgi:GxxExxY protein